MVLGCGVNVDKATHILILAAGASSRMRGGDKLMEIVEGQPLLRVLAMRALATGCPVTIALPEGPHKRYEVIDDLEVTTLPVPDADQGMNVSLRRGIQALSASANRVLLVLGDLPDITTEHMNAILAAPINAPFAKIWRGATSDGAPGHPVLFDQALFSEFDELNGDGGAHQVVAAARGAIHLVPFVSDIARRDLDTPEDWAEWRAQSDNGT